MYSQTSGLVVLQNGGTLFRHKYVVGRITSKAPFIYCHNACILTRWITVSERLSGHFMLWQVLQTQVCKCTTVKHRLSVTRLSVSFYEPAWWRA